MPKSADDNSSLCLGGAGSGFTGVSTNGDAMGTVTERPRGPARGALVPATGLRRRACAALRGCVPAGPRALVPIEKLFMTSIGFDAAGVGLMAAVYAAVYAAVVPFFEVP